MDEYEYLKNLCQDHNHNAYDKRLHERLIQKGFHKNLLSEQNQLLIETLDKDNIYQLINDKSLLSFDNLHILYETNSTNTYIRNFNCKEPIVVAAEYQTDAYGRRGNQWLGNLLQQLSFSIKFDSDCKTPSLLPIFFALEVAKFLNAYKIKNVQVKWPNDILISGEKCAGLMIEAIRCGNENSYIFGMGINIFNLAIQLDKPICSISEHTRDENLLSRNKCLAGLLNVILTAIINISNFDEEKIIMEFNQYNVLYDGEFLVRQNDQLSYKARYKQLNKDGSLQVIVNQKIMDIYSAEVSLQL